MKKSLLATSMALALSTGSTQAAFFSPGTTGTITVTSGCFDYEACVVDGIGDDDIIDNSITVGGVGSGIAGDGVVGIMNFTVGADGNSFSLTSFNMDSYLATACGNTGFRMQDLSVAGGFVDDAGNMDLDVTGRTQLITCFIASFGEVPWNIETHGAGPGGPEAVPFLRARSGLYTPFTTGTSTALNCFTGDTVISVAGSALTPTGVVNEWTGTLVSAGNYGDYLGFFDGTPYSEIYNITVTTTMSEGCAADWPVSTITTLGKGQSPSNNAKVSTTITGHIVDPDSLRESAARVPICANTNVAVAVTDTSGTPTITPELPTVVRGSTVKFIVRSQDGSDTDRFTLLPR